MYFDLNSKLIIGITISRVLYIQKLHQQASSACLDMYECEINVIITVGLFRGHWIYVMVKTCMMVKMA